MKRVKQEPRSKLGNCYIQSACDPNLRFLFFVFYAGFMFTQWKAKLINKEYIDRCFQRQSSKDMILNELVTVDYLFNSVGVAKSLTIFIFKNIDWTYAFREDILINIECKYTNKIAVKRFRDSINQCLPEMYVNTHKNMKQVKNIVLKWKSAVNILYSATKSRTMLQNGSFWKSQVYCAGQ